MIRFITFVFLVFFGVNAAAKPILHRRAPFSHRTRRRDFYCPRPYRSCSERRTSFTTFSTWWVWGNMSTGCTASTR